MDIEICYKPSRIPFSLLAVFLVSRFFDHLSSRFSRVVFVCSLHFAPQPFPDWILLNHLTTWNCSHQDTSDFDQIHLTGSCNSFQYSWPLFSAYSPAFLSLWDIFLFFSYLTPCRKFLQVSVVYLPPCIGISQRLVPALPPFLNSSLQWSHSVY